MNNLPAIQLPAHLQKLQSNPALMAANTTLSAGISSGGWPRISIKGNRFRLIAPGADEITLQTLLMDIIVIEGNPHPTLSKTYYKDAYNPDAEDVGPVCWSDNGVGPSYQSTSPQCSTCAACPHNVWGSKISQNGKQVKACTDSKKLAVFMADNTAGNVYEFRIPPASLKNWLAYIGALTKGGIAGCSIVTRVSFDPEQVGILIFEPAGLKRTGNMPYITEEQANDLMDVVGSDEVAVCIGTKDKPIDASRVVAAATTVIAQQPLPAISAPSAPAYNPPPSAPAYAPPPSAPVQVAGPTPAQAAGPLPKAPDAPKRARRTKAEMAAPQDAAQVQAQAQAQAQGGHVPLPAFLQNMPQGQMVLPPVPPANNAANVAPINPPVANATLADLLAKAMAT